MEPPKTWRLGKGDANVTKSMLLAILACSSKMTALFGEWVITEAANWEMLIPRTLSPAIQLVEVVDVGFISLATYALKSDGSLETNKRRQWFGISCGC